MGPNRTRHACGPPSPSTSAAAEAPVEPGSEGGEASVGARALRSALCGPRSPASGSAVAVVVACARDLLRHPPRALALLAPQDGDCDEGPTPEQRPPSARHASHASLTTARWARLMSRRRDTSASTRQWRARADDVGDAEDHRERDAESRAGRRHPLRLEVLGRGAGGASRSARRAACVVSTVTAEGGSPRQRRRAPDEARSPGPHRLVGDGFGGRQRPPGTRRHRPPPPARREGPCARPSRRRHGEPSPDRPRTSRRGPPPPAGRRRGLAKRLPKPAKDRCRSPRVRASRCADSPSSRSPHTSMAHNGSSSRDGKSSHDEEVVFPPPPPPPPPGVCSGHAEVRDLISLLRSSRPTTVTRETRCGPHS